MKLVDLYEYVEPYTLFSVYNINNEYEACSEMSNLPLYMVSADIYSIEPIRKNCFKVVLYIEDSSIINK